MYPACLATTVRISSRTGLISCVTRLYVLVVSTSLYGIGVCTCLTFTLADDERNTICIGCSSGTTSIICGSNMDIYVIFPDVQIFVHLFDRLYDDY
ncbi:hypothetical protein DERP_009166 [Dermatophagoides pteronyssinus]|uniref:Uncharacterized protein n=1 Tax=Dermatophagoides pteronyssinus TaxID=6956 RepID=A0ABQ8JQQ1_DERPT|nr:hypothetical protein DERP_009166 [Dermatophagoides pteronyssinus]